MKTKIIKTLGLFDYEYELKETKTYKNYSYHEIRITGDIDFCMLKHLINNLKKEEENKLYLAADDCNLLTIYWIEK